MFQLAEQAVELALEDYRDEKGEDSEVVIIEGFRVDPAPLTYKGASVEVDLEHVKPSEDDCLEKAVIQTAREHPDIDMFSSGTLWDEGYFYASLKDTERTGR